MRGTPTVVRWLLAPVGGQNACDLKWKRLPLGCWCTMHKVHPVNPDPDNLNRTRRWRLWIPSVSDCSNIIYWRSMWSWSSAMSDMAIHPVSQDEIKMKLHAIYDNNHISTTCIDHLKRLPMLCPHVSGLHQDRKVFVPYLWRHASLDYDGMSCFFLTLTLALRWLYYFSFVTAWPAGFKVDSTHVFKGRS